MAMVVLLPAPFGPSSPKTSPRSMVSDRASTAVMWPKRLVRLSSVITGPAPSRQGVGP